LVRRGKPPRLGEWSLPGGRQEWGETVEAALRREVREETGLDVGPLRFVDVVDLVATEADGTISRHYTLLDYTAEAGPGEPVAGDDAAAVGWFDLTTVATLGLWDETHAVIERAAALRRDGPHSMADG
jgi:ADP-ribose pyrophosphatase YjhB (NUDIX family)